MKMLDGNTAALSAHEAHEDSRQKSYDRHEKEAESLLREWVRDGETIGKPREFEKLSVFVLADMITDDPYRYGLDNEFVGNLLTQQYRLEDYMQEAIKRVGDNTYAAWRATPEADDWKERIVSYLEECAREDAD